MRLGFHYHVPATEKGGEIFTPGFQGRFIDSLADYCDAVICFLHTPVSGEKEILDYCIQSPNVKLVGIGPHNSVIERLLREREIRKNLSAWKGQLDAILLRGPSPLLPLMSKIFASIPVTLLIVGDNTIGIDDLPQPRWRREMIRIFQTCNKRQQIKASKRGLTFVNSKQRYQEYQKVLPNLIETRTTTLSQKDFYIRQDTCEEPPYKLLYTGRMDRTKGLFELVEAISILVREDIDVVLGLVGWPQKNDNIMYELASLAEKLGVDERIQFHGYKPVGPELFGYYKEADIYVIASYSEGFPRTIWEAMANSLPVVATEVGSIPDFVGDAAILVESRDPLKLAKGIKKLIGDKNLRKNLIQRGLEIALQNTIEVQTKILVDNIKEYSLEKGNEL